MRTTLTDLTGLCSRSQMQTARERVYFALARFGHKINGINIRLSRPDPTQHNNFHCEIMVSIEGSGLVATRREAPCLQAAIALATAAIEPRVAYRVDWRSWFNADTFSTWMVSASQPLNWLYDFDYRTSVAS